MFGSGYVQVRDMRRDFMNIIEAKKKNPNDGGISAVFHPSTTIAGTKRKDLADMLIEARDPETGKPLDNEVHHILFASSSDEMMQVIIDQFLTLMLAGHDTTAHTLTWILHMLSERPDAEAKVRVSPE